MPPADPRHLAWRRAVQAPVAGQKRELNCAADHFQRRLDGAGDGLDQRGLAGTGFSGEPVNLAAPDIEADAIDRLDGALDAEMVGAKVGPQIADREDRRGAGGLVHLRHDTAPMRLRRLRGSMYSFIDTASRNSPMKVMITAMVGKAIHHHTPATIAVCWLAQ